MVYNTAEGKAILFGGDTNPAALGDTRAYDAASNTWTSVRIFPVPRRPTPGAMVAGEAVERRRCGRRRLAVAGKQAGLFSPP
ncbi:MAG: hypothetical protein JW990_09200 [Thermoleophilia bacterium]|nr:hypothetical protein [Thermoleophilia bacterium]